MTLTMIGMHGVPDDLRPCNRSPEDRTILNPLLLPATMLLAPSTGTRDLGAGTRMSIATAPQAGSRHRWSSVTAV